MKTEVQFISVNPFPSGSTILLGITAGLVLFGCARCTKCRMRDIPCWRFCMRRFVDTFDEFNLTVTVHSLQILGNLKGRKLDVVVKADRAVENTSKMPDGVWEKTVALRVEQGVSNIKVEVLDQKGKAVAALDLDPIKDVLNPQWVSRRSYKMQQLARDFSNPVLTLSLYVDGCSGPDLESAEDKEVQAIGRIGKDMGGLSTELRAELLRTVAEEEEKASEEPGTQSSTSKSHQKHHDARSKLQAELDLLAKAACGRLNKPSELFGKMKEVYVDVAGPPVLPKWHFRIFKKEKDREDNVKAEVEVDLLKIAGFTPDPVRENFFAMKYIDKDKNIIVLFFERVDRPRDVWIEQLDLLVGKVREMREKRVKNKPKDTDKSAEEKEGGGMTGIFKRGNKK